MAAERPTGPATVSRAPLIFRAIGLTLALGALGSAGCEGPPEIPGSEPTQDAPGVVERITRPVAGGEVHLVRLGQRGDAYRAEPAELTISSGDAVRFIMAGQQPESIVFDPVEASPEAAAYIRAHALHLGVLMTDPGETHDVVFRDAPPGTYPFRSLPHGDRGLRGTVTLTP